MSQFPEEIKNCIVYLNNAATWDDSDLDYIVESLFRKRFSAPVRSVHRSSMLLAYHLDIKKDLGLSGNSRGRFLSKESARYLYF